jgi:hypothetical protein
LILEIEASNLISRYHVSFKEFKTTKTQRRKQTSREGKCGNPFKVDILFLLAANTYTKRLKRCKASIEDLNMLKVERKIKNRTVYSLEVEAVEPYKLTLACFEQ